MKRNPLFLTFLLITGVLAGCTSSSEKEQASQTRSATQTPAQTPADSNRQKTILFFGNSLTAGYGVDPAEAFPGRIGQRLDSLKLNYRVINAGVSGETTAGGRSRVGWTLRQPVDIFVLELGGNDGLRGLPLAATRQNLQAIIDTVRARSPQAQIVLAGMQIPPNMGPDYTSEFRQIYPELAKKNNLTLIPFLLEGVGGIPRLNQPDGIHPTPEGHKLVAETVWKTLESLVRAQGV
ncbi:arylesterase [Tellurirhabdus rosea]|uniref:arylesterase n=1 Tax=Tellurirhabdus rosea TaxID=2674997 RepID=UPI00224F9D64|nr:arylesterase [Tellurirhabdus rosea]